MLIKYFYGVVGLYACTVEYLVPAAGAGGGDKGGCYLSDSGEEDHLADGHAGGVMFFLVTETARHTATAAGNDMYGGTYEAQALGCFLDTDEGFLVAVAVEVDGGGV